VIGNFREACNDADCLESSVIDITLAAYKRVISRPEITYIQLQEIDKLLAAYPEPEYPLIRKIEKKPLSDLQKEILGCDNKFTITYERYVKSLCVEFRRKFEIAFKRTTRR
jgi:hypothetical protein